MNSTDEEKPNATAVTNYLFQFNQISSYTLLVWTATLLLIISTSVNLLINYTRTKFQLIKLIPECCIQVIFGLIVGAIIHFSSSSLESSILSLFTPNAFFTFILPPILIEAGYFMPRQAFSVNIVFILGFAVFGTILNCFILAGLLYGVGAGGLSPGLPFLELLMFCAIISAVDPVAVIAVFQELNVNLSLYIVEFGESLLNDGVSLVLFQIFQAMIQNQSLSLTELGLLGIIKFIWIMGAGVFTGIICGIFGSLLTKWCSRDYQNLEPFFIYGTAFFAYTTCNLLSISSIFGVISCTFFMRPYVEVNISQKNKTTIDYSIKLMAHIAEMMVFILLGIVTTSVFDSKEPFEWSFNLLNILFVTIVRFLVVFALGFILNLFSMRKLSFKDQFIVAFSGLRGGIAFGMIYSLQIENRIMYIQSTLIIIFFTVFIQGSSVGPLLNFFKVEKEPSESETRSMLETTIDHLSIGVKDILGSRTDSFYFYHRMGKFSDRHIKPKLTTNKRNVYPCKTNDSSSNSITDSSFNVRKRAESKESATSRDKIMIEDCKV